MTTFWHTRQVDMPFEDIKNKLVNSLKSQWFGVLMEIDIQAKIKEKLWKDMEDYLVLWVCNPDLAYQALNVEIEIWLLLPCNIILYTKGRKNYVSTILPTVAMSFVWNESLMKIAQDAEVKLKEVIDNL